MAPEQKKRKTEEPADEVEEAKPAAAEPKVVKAPEPPQEKESDAAPIKGAKLSDEVGFLAEDTTLNVLPSDTGSILMTLSDHAMQNFIAGARANVGISKGRYFFEAKILETTAYPLLRVGFSTAGSQLILGATEHGIAFDSEGFVLHNSNQTAKSNGLRIKHGTVVGVLLNLDAASENVCTISLFKDGRRASEPQPLPQGLQGQTLFPHISYRGVTVHANFGSTPLAPLPFKCHMVQDVAQNHCTVTKTASDGKHQVLYPVSLPDEGSFDWLDCYKEKNSGFTELSDRMIFDWAKKSGLIKGSSGLTSNDKPELQGLDEPHIRKAVYTIAPLQLRNYIVMEVKGNLLEDERKQLLDKFPESFFKKVAMVLIGDPTPDFKKRTQEMNLKRKQASSDALFRTRKAEEKRKKLADKKKKEAERAAKKRAKEAKKKAKEAKKKAEAEKQAKAGTPAEEDKAESEEEVESEVEEEVEVEDTEAPPKVELDAEEKKVVFFNHPVKDLMPATLSTTFAKFTVPKQEEGFTEIQYVWSKGDKASDYVKKWIMDKKLHLRVEHLNPGAWSEKEVSKWNAAVNTWHKSQKGFKDLLAAKAKAKAERAAKKAKAAALKAAKEKALAEAEKKKVEKKEEGEKKEEEAKEETKEEAKEEESEVELELIDFSKIDIYGIRDILDLGQGMPLVAEFGGADWAMLALRFELHHLVHAFKKDVDDPDRAGILVEHIPFYFQKYFRKTLNPKDYGVDNCADLCQLVNDTVYLNEQNVLQSLLPEEMESFAVFAKLVEDARRHRQLRMDLGEEGAVLKLNMRALENSAAHPQHAVWSKGAKGADGKGKALPPGATGAKGAAAGKGASAGKGAAGQWVQKGVAKGKTQTKGAGFAAKGAAKGTQVATIPVQKPLFVKPSPGQAKPGLAPTRPVGTMLGASFRAAAAQSVTAGKGALATGKGAAFAGKGPKGAAGKGAGLWPATPAVRPAAPAKGMPKGATKAGKPPATATYGKTQAGQAGKGYQQTGQGYAQAGKGCAAAGGKAGGWGSGSAAAGKGTSKGGWDGAGAAWGKGKW